MRAQKRLRRETTGIQSIDKFITRHSTEARATMSLSQTEKECLKSFLKTLTDGVVRQLSGRESQSLGAATEKRRAKRTKAGQVIRKRQNSGTASTGL